MGNREWAHAIIDTLIQLGADTFVTAPGSRSTPLLFALGEHPQACSYTHFDERSLGFFALGVSKATHKPTVLIVTSGTAVANLLPAVMEADLSHTPLILLTADRPPELRDCGANQTCDQVKLFANSVRWQVDLSCPDPLLQERYLSSTLSHAVAMAGGPMPGPVHVNCPFREPLLTGGEGVLQNAVPFTHGTPCLDEATLEEWAERLAQEEEGVILLGSDSVFSTQLLRLAEHLQWPLFPDILSPARSLSHPLLISHFDLLLQAEPNFRCKAILQFGERHLSKTLYTWLSKQSPTFHVHVSPYTRRHDPTHQVTHRLQTSSERFAQGILPYLKTRDSDPSAWTRGNAHVQEKLSSLFQEESSLTEPSLLFHFHPLLTQGWALFLGNSMPIRDAHLFLQTGGGPCFANRGVSGIDGNIATAAGLAAGLKRPILALIGDLACLYDLNALALLHSLDTPVVLCVVNNQGGGIFSFLPIAEKKEIFERFVAAAHPWNFEHAASLFHLPYLHPTTPEALQSHVHRLAAHPTSCLIEITTDRQENVRVHESLLKEVCSSFGIFLGESVK